MLLNNTYTQNDQSDDFDLQRKYELRVDWSSAEKCRYTVKIGVFKIVEITLFEAEKN